MKKLGNLRRFGAVLMAGILIFSMVGCKKKADMNDNIEEVTTEEFYEAMNSLEDHVAPGVMLPADFGYMFYPMEALTIEEYTKGLPYYKEGENPDSFWFSMAVLSTLLAENDLVSPIVYDEYYYYTEDEIASFATTLYDAYQRGEMTLPEIAEDTPFACYEEDLDVYGLLYGNIGDLSVFITDCMEYKDGYQLQVQLENVDTSNVMAEFKIVIMPKEELKDEDLFAYSVSEVTMMDENSSEIIVETTEEEVASNEATPEDDLDEVDGVEITDDTPDEDIDETTEEENTSSDAKVAIDQKEALAMAKDYMGEEASYSFKQMVTIGEYDYYDFAVSGNASSSTDVLVCVNGIDVVGGVQNSDGSWTFDQ